MVTVPSWAKDRVRPYRGLGYLAFAAHQCWFADPGLSLLLLPLSLFLLEALPRWSYAPSGAVPVLLAQWLQLGEVLLLCTLFVIQALPLPTFLLFSASLVLAKLALGGVWLAAQTLLVTICAAWFLPLTSNASVDRAQLLLPLLLLWVYACGFAALGYHRVARLKASKQAVEAQVSLLETRAARQRAYLPLPLRMRLADDGPSTPRRERCWLVVLFLDLCDFSALTERLDAAALERVFDDFLRAAQVIAQGHDGVMAKVLGDGLLLWWRPEQDQPQRRLALARQAVACSRALHDELARLSRQGRERGELFELSARIALTAGYCSLGDWGLESDHRTGALMEFTALGAPVNRAARLQQVATRGTTVLDEALATLLESCEPLSAAASIELKGIGETRFRTLRPSCQKHLTLVS